MKTNTVIFLTNLGRTVAWEFPAHMKRQFRPLEQVQRIDVMSAEPYFAS